MEINLVESASNFNYFRKSLQNFSADNNNHLYITLLKKDASGSLACYTTDDKKSRASLKEINQFAENVLSQNSGLAAKGDVRNSVEADDRFALLHIAEGLKKIHAELSHQRKTHTIFQRIWFWMRGGEGVLASTKQLADKIYERGKEAIFQAHLKKKSESSSSAEVKNPEPLPTPVEAPVPVVAPPVPVVAPPVPVVAPPVPGVIRILLSDLFREKIGSAPKVASTDIGEIRDFFNKNPGVRLCKLTAYPSAVAVFVDFKHKIAEKDDFKRKYSEGLVVVLDLEGDQIKFPDRERDTINIMPVVVPKIQEKKEAPIAPRNILDESSDEEENIAPARFNINPIHKIFSDCLDAKVTVENLFEFLGNAHIDDLPLMLGIDVDVINEQTKTQWLAYKLLSGLSFKVDDTMDLFGKKVVGEWTFFSRA